MSITLNQPAPDFTLPDENGVMHSLSQYRGKSVVLYFYPKDDTPGCTTEACNFRDDYSAYDKNGVVILGVSPDSSKSHAKFKAKFNLPFTLLADEDQSVCELYDSWGPKKFLGRVYDGVLRNTYLIDPNGVVIQVWEGVKPADHSQEVLQALANWQST